MEEIVKICNRVVEDIENQYGIKLRVCVDGSKPVKNNFSGIVVTPYTYIVMYKGKWNRKPYINDVNLYTHLYNDVYEFIIAKVIP